MIWLTCSLCGQVHVEDDDHASVCRAANPPGPMTPVDDGKMSHVLYAYYGLERYQIKIRVPRGSSEIEIEAAAHRAIQDSKALGKRGPPDRLSFVG